MIEHLHKKTAEKKKRDLYLMRPARPDVASHAAPTVLGREKRLSSYSYPDSLCALIDENGLIVWRSFGGAVYLY
jgi:hypothetical protein